MRPDKEFVKRRFAQRLRQYHQMAQVQQGIAAELATIYKLHFDSLEPSRIYEAGAGTGFLTRYLRFYHPEAEFFLNDLTDAAAPFLGELMSGYKTRYLWGDAERIPVPEGTDALFSASTIQWFEDLPAFLRMASDATTKGGALVLSSFGPENFKEIRCIRGEGLDYLPKTELGRMVEEAGYQILHLSEQTRVLYFDIAVDVVYHIKYTGVNALMPVRWTKERLKEFTERYTELFRTREGVVPLTYHPVFVVARKK
ncbi:MAG: methyltransferase domain-containing protein [Rikenellaceae bacterium]|nr:methyltransferase domain-containing protein [Rikenellaceae bacterium]